MVVKGDKKLIDKYQHLSTNEMEIMQILIIFGRTFGLDIMDKVNEGRREFNLPEIGYGSFYGALKKLEREKFIKSSTPDTDKRRKYYQVTALGEETYQANFNYQNRLGQNTGSVLM
ncbi:PadR family transcriptional regulator [Gloeothece citriformis]|nr:helix-turn-helix transcriptional regulator [Gloeothece citriformis]